MKLGIKSFEATLGPWAARSFQDPRWRASVLGEGVSQRFARAARRPFKITMTSATS